VTIRTPIDLGALIRERRTRLGLDQSSLARKAGTSRQWLVALEKGKPRAEIGLILRTLEALNLSLTTTERPNAKDTNQINARSKTSSAIDINRLINDLRTDKR